jgi:hypothetical protein
MLKAALLAFPDAIDPVESSKNQASKPPNTAFLTPSGDASNT